MAKYLIVDPPSGWRYGFPKPIINREWYFSNPEEWFKSKGYPQELIDQGMLKHVRFWEAEVNEDEI